MRLTGYSLVVIIAIISNIAMKKIEPDNVFYLPYSIAVLIILALGLMIF